MTSYHWYSARRATRTPSPNCSIKNPFCSDWAASAAPSTLSCSRTLQRQGCFLFDTLQFCEWLTKENPVCESLGKQPGASGNPRTDTSSSSSQSNWVIWPPRWMRQISGLKSERLSCRAQLHFAKESRELASIHRFCCLRDSGPLTGWMSAVQRRSNKKKQ